MQFLVLSCAAAGAVEFTAVHVRPRSTACLGDRIGNNRNTLMVGVGLGLALGQSQGHSPLFRKTSILRYFQLLYDVVP